MTVSAHLSTIVAALASDVAPVVAHDDRARAAVAQSLDVLRRLIVNAETGVADPALLERAAIALGLDADRPAEAPDISLELPNRPLGGAAFRREADAAALSRVENVDAATFAHMAPVARWEADAYRRLEDSWLGMRASKQMGDDTALKVDPDRLNAHLRVRFPQWPDIRLTYFRQIAGGRSKQTVLFGVAGAPGLPPDLVLRRDHPIGISDSSVVDEYPLLARLHAAGVTVAEPHFLEPSREVLGGPFMVSTAIAGRSAGELFEPRSSPPLALALAGELGRIHAQPVEVYRGLTGRLEPIELAEYGRRLDLFEQMWREKDGPGSPSIRIAFAWLRAHLHHAPGRATLVHGDAGFHNVLADGDVFLALLDWEFASIGNPAEDLGFARMTVERMVDWDDWMRAYRKAGGPDVPQAEIDFYAIWGAVRLASLVAYARWLINSGAISDLAFATSSIVDMNRILGFVADGLTRVLEQPDP